MDNYCGRLVKLWLKFSTKFVWFNELCDNIVALVIAYTNFHIVMRKLRDNDGSWYNRNPNLMLHIGESKKRKRVE